MTVKAKAWARRREKAMSESNAAESARPEFIRWGVAARVDDSGHMTLTVREGGMIFEEKDALELGEWILATFGDHND